MNGIMLTAVILSAVMVNVIMLSVVAPRALLMVILMATLYGLADDFLS
jgi:hypothetical protein